MLFTCGLCALSCSSEVTNHETGDDIKKFRLWQGRVKKDGRPTKGERRATKGNETRITDLCKVSEIEIIPARTGEELLIRGFMQGQAS